MRKAKRCLMAAICLLLSLSLLTGCVPMVDSYIVFSIDGGYDDFSFSTMEDREEVILAGQFESARYQDTYICPVVRIITHEESRLDICTYTFSPAEQVVVESAVLYNEDGEVLCRIEDSAIDYALATEKMYYGGTSSEPFAKADDDFSNGDKLVLHLDMRIGSDVLKKVYTITVKQYRSPLTPT